MFPTIIASKGQVKQHIYVVQLTDDHSGSSRVLVRLPHEGRSALRSDRARMWAAHGTAFSFMEFDVIAELRTNEVTTDAEAWRLIDSVI